MDDAASFVRQPLDTAAHIIPLGLHLGSDGTLVFDAHDDALEDDVRTFIQVLARESEDGQVGLPTVTRELDNLSRILGRVVSEMKPGEGGDRYDIMTMLASAFDRFPHFIDSRELASGSGDVQSDPTHKDRALFDQTQIDLTRQGS